MVNRSIGGYGEQKGKTGGGGTARLSACGCMETPQEGSVAFDGGGVLADDAKDVSRLTSTLETVLMPPWALAAEMEESPTATRPR